MMSQICSKYKLLGKFIKELVNREKKADEILEEINKLIQLGKVNPAK
jgi:hypothetical protein